MNLIDEKVSHEVFGDGKVKEHDDSFIVIDFKSDVKKFVYPDAIGTYISFKDEQTAKTMEKIVETQMEKERERERKRQKKEEQRVLDQIRREKLKNQQIHESSQAVFWLGKEEKERAFEEWTVFTGAIQSGKNEGKPNRAARLRPNSAILLTERHEDEKEESRKIIGIYMVHETFAGNMNEDGMIHAHEQYKLKLSEEESDKMLFWNYYKNKRHPERMTWNSGVYRYYDNMWTAQILKDIIELKEDEKEKGIVTDFLHYFCKMNVIEPNEIEPANGALKQ